MKSPDIQCLLTLKGVQEDIERKDIIQSIADQALLLFHYVYIGNGKNNNTVYNKERTNRVRSRIAVYRKGGEDV